jgi:alginate O-acetyltransferase complex protein AlgI
MNLDFFLSCLMYDPKNPMLFQSVLFFGAFSIFYLIYSFFNNDIKVRNALLLAFSLFFYYKISGGFVLALIFMASVDYLVARNLPHAKSERKKILLLSLSLFINVGGLLFFKYTYFFLDVYNSVSGSTVSLAMKIIQPIGISYFVFKSLGYVLDVKREVIEEPEKNYANYLLYVSFFPNILAGPISKARDLLPKFKENSLVDKKTINAAVFIIIIGLIKKIAIADYLAANMVGRVFESPQFFSGVDLFMACYGGLIQLFFDFSGYTDIVVGLALLMGFQIKGNFNQPFKAKNITDFWRRWHISLYEWLSEYIYQPLAIIWRKQKLMGTLMAVIITFLISGIWHGPNWVFIIWGSLHGLMICWDVLTSKYRSKLATLGGKYYSFFSVFLTFHFIVFSAVLLKSPSFNYTIDYYSQLLTTFDPEMLIKWFEIYSWPFGVMIIGLALQFLPLNFYSKIENSFVKTPLILSSIILVIIIFSLYQLSYMEAMPFLYIVY